MNRIIPIAILGDGPHARALQDHAAPIGRFAIRPDWKDAEAVLALGAAGAQVDDIAAALRAGRIVLCSPPVARDISDLARIGSGTLIVAGEIASSEAGSRALELIRAPEFGRLNSLYVAIRRPRGAGADVLDEIGWEAPRFRAVGSQARTRAHDSRRTIRRRALTTAVILMQTEDDAVNLHRTFPLPPADRAGARSGRGGNRGARRRSFHPPRTARNQRPDLPRRRHRHRTLARRPGHPHAAHGRRRRRRCSSR